MKKTTVDSVLVWCGVVLAVCAILAAAYIGTVIKARIYAREFSKVLEAQKANP